jgi:Fe-S oxidoreductase
MYVSLFITCLADTRFRRPGVRVVEILEWLDHVVSFPAERTCCGQLHGNAGYPQPAQRTGDQGLLRAVEEIGKRAYELSELLADASELPISALAYLTGSPSIRPATPSDCCDWPRRRRVLSGPRRPHDCGIARGCA